MSEAVVRRCSSSKQVFLKICKTSQESTCVEPLFNKVVSLKACNFIKKRLQHSCFPVKCRKFFKNIFFYRTPLVAASDMLNFSRFLYYVNQDFATRNLWSIIFVKFLNANFRFSFKQILENLFFPFKGNLNFKSNRWEIM